MMSLREVPSMGMMSAAMNGGTGMQFRLGVETERSFVVRYQYHP